MPNTPTAELTATNQPASESLAPLFPAQSLMLTNIVSESLFTYKVLAYEIEGELYIKKSDADRIFAIEERNSERERETEGMFIRKGEQVAQLLSERYRLAKEKIKDLECELEYERLYSEGKDGEIEALEYQVEGLRNFIRSYSNLNNQIEEI